MQNRLSDWFLVNNADNDNVRTWLRRHEYNGLSFFKHLSRPPTATVELFIGKSMQTDNNEILSLPVKKSRQCANESHLAEGVQRPKKRHLQNAPDHIAKRQFERAAPVHKTEQAPRKAWATLIRPATLSLTASVHMQHTSQD